MDGTPDVATIGSLIGDRARADILMCLMAGRALTATELASAARVTKQTASAHLSKLVKAQLLVVESVGRHGYFKLTDPDVGTVIEDLAVLAHRAGAMQVDTGPIDPALRKARVCYDHLAGELGVRVYDSLRQRGLLRISRKNVTRTAEGEAFCGEMGIDIAGVAAGKRALWLACLDWNVRRHHLAGALGSAFLRRFFALGWARPRRGTRIVTFSAVGERSLLSIFNLREHAQ